MKTLPLSIPEEKGRLGFQSSRRIVCFERASVCDDQVQPSVGVQVRELGTPAHDLQGDLSQSTLVGRLSQLADKADQP